MATIVKREAQDGTITYQARIRLRGGPPRSRTFKRLTDAKAWAAAAEADMGKGVYVPSTADRRTTLAMLIDRFIAEYLPVKEHRKTADQLQALLAWWKVEAGHVTLDKLTPAMIAATRNRLAASISKRTKRTLSGASINRHLSALSTACAWACADEVALLTENPVHRVKKRPEAKGRERYLSDAERKALLAATAASTDPNLHVAVLLSLATGARRGNITQLRWADVDFAASTLHFADTKNGEARTVALVGAAETALRAHHERDPTRQGWVFKSRVSAAPAGMREAWDAAVAEAGLVNFRWHDLRHSTGSYLTMNGASLAEVADALGHKTLAMARRYSHTSAEHQRSVLASMADKFLGDEE